MQLFPKEAAAPAGTKRPAPSGPQQAGRRQARQGRDVLDEITSERVLAELAQIAFADLGAEPPPPIKAGDKLRALELMVKFLGLSDSAAADPVVLVDEPPGPGKEAEP